MERRGLTLIELLAAIAIVAVLGALALPAVESRLEGARFDAATKGIEAGVVMARAEAQQRGTVVSLVARAIRGGETGLFVEAAPAAGATSVGGGPARDASAGVEVSAQDTSGAGATTGAAGVGASLGTPVVVIGSGERVIQEAPEIAGGGGGRTRGNPALPPAMNVVPAGGFASRQAAAPDSPIVIARFLPDGTAVAAGPVWVVGQAAAAEISVNRWMGSVTVRLVDLSGGTEGSDTGAAPPAESAPPPASNGGSASKGAGRADPKQEQKP